MKLIRNFVVFSIMFGLLISASSSFTKSNSKVLSSIRNSKGPSFSDNSIINNPDSLKPTPVSNIKHDSPPADFNPITASNSDLKKYHFPERPTDPNKQKRWENAMQHAKTYVAPQLIYPTVNPTTDIRKATSTNWAGVVIQTGNAIRETDTELDLPSYNSSAYADPCFWTGIGGYGTGDIVQAGADINSSILWGNFSTLNPYCFWFEDYPYGPVYTATPSIGAGDQIYIEVEWFDNSSDGSYAFLLNERTGQYTDIQFNGKYYDGSSADYIYEATSSKYASWGGVEFLEGYLMDTSSGGNMSQYNHIDINMVDSSGKTRATTSDYSDWFWVQSQ